MKTFQTELAQTNFTLQKVNHIVPKLLVRLKEVEAERDALLDAMDSFRKIIRDKNKQIEALRPFYKAPSLR